MNRQTPGSRRAALRRCGLVLAVLSSVQLFAARADAAPAEEARPQVRDDAYGETLYAFYQKQYFAAISRLLVARERGELKQQPQDGELLLGGLFVQYGMPDAATRVFSGLLPQQVDIPADNGKGKPKVSAQEAQAARIWLALAELNYRRDRYPEALAIITEHFSQEQPPDAAVMLAVKSLMRLGRYREAVSWIGPSFSTLPESRYLRFNLAIALIADGDSDGCLQLLQPLLAMPAHDDEMLALRDRVALALAATYLKQGRPAEAARVLSSARADGPYSSEAMLIHGIASQRSGALDVSVRSLSALVQRPPRLQAVLEGWIALAQVQEARGDSRRALATYRVALKHLQEQLAWLQVQQDNIDSGEWFAALDRRAGDIALRDSRSGAEDADFLGMPLHYRQFAGNRFVSSYTQYVEVSTLARVATDWQARIPALSWLVDDRQRRHTRLRAEAAQLLMDTPVAPLQQQQADFSDRVERTLTRSDPLQYATEERQRLAGMAAQIETRMARWPEKDWSSAREKLALLQGVLRWEAEREQPAQAWALRRTSRDNGRLVEETGRRRAALEHAMGVQQVSVDGWLPALDADGRELTRLATESGRLRVLLRQRMEDDARETIRAQRELIVQLAAEAYFAIGQITHGRWNEKRDEKHSPEEDARSAFDRAAFE